jgi:hypothetical protein
LATPGAPGEHHPLAGHEVLHPHADFFDDTGALVTEDHRQRADHGPGHVVEFGVAHSGGLDPHQHLPRQRWFEIDVLDLQWSAWSA